MAAADIAQLPVQGQPHHTSDANIRAQGLDDQLPRSATTDFLPVEKDEVLTETTAPANGYVLPDPYTTIKASNTVVAGYPESDLKLDLDHHIDDVRSLRAIVIGAGLTGVLAGILLPAKVPKLQLTILEKNDDVVRLSSPHQQVKLMTSL